ncbi:MAG: hypothetical protein CMJ64_02780 [Planctomycetaceae bacterium]|nr:hypothetical protein [Planctomycetaceae bacterium]
MAKKSLLEKVEIINSTVRTLVGATLLGGIGVGGWYGYTQFNAKELEAERHAQALSEAHEELELTHAQLEEAGVQIEQKDAEIGDLNVQVEDQQREIERLDTAMRLLKVDHRVARISVVDQRRNEENDSVVTVIEFQELNENGDPLDDVRTFEIAGDVVYVDSWVVKFDDKYVEEADIDRATSLVLFRRLFGERQEPREGFALDQEGTRPKVYGTGAELSDFEKKIWGDFWDVAHDDTKQEELGIRAIHGEAPSIKVKKGKAYRLDLRASGGLSIRIDGDIPVRESPAA